MTYIQSPKEINCIFCSVQNQPDNPENLVIARGDAFPDALGGGVACGKAGGVLELTTTSPLEASTKARMAARRDRNMGKSASASS